jgi:hypothetical protein
VRTANDKTTGIFSVPRAAFYELASLEDALRCTRNVILEELTRLRRECALEPEFDEQLLAQLQTTLDRISRLRRQCLDIRQRRRELQREHELTPSDA